MTRYPKADDPAALDRFLAAQDRTHDAALAELSQGRKRRHWMWFVFPQLRGLGHSPHAQFYGIADGDEAAAYLAHPVLGPRLIACARAMLTHADKPAERILGPVDALKLRSSATLFAEVAPDPSLFRQILDRFFDGAPCGPTMGRLRGTTTPDRV